MYLCIRNPENGVRKRTLKKCDRKRKKDDSEGVGPPSIKDAGHRRSVLQIAEKKEKKNKKQRRV